MLKAIGIVGLLFLLALFTAAMLAVPFTGMDPGFVFNDDHDHVVLGGFMGWMIAGFVVLIVGTILTVVFAGVSVLLICVAVLVVFVVALALIVGLLPILLPILVLLGLPFLVIYAFAKAMK